jgi:hypothetical protein
VATLEGVDLIEAGAFQSSIGVAVMNAKAVKASDLGVGVKRNLVRLAQAFRISSTVKRLTSGNFFIEAIRFTKQSDHPVTANILTRSWLSSSLRLSPTRAFRSRRTRRADGH